MKPLEITPLARLRIVKRSIVDPVNISPPEAPENLSVSTVGASTYSISWDASTDPNVSEYRVYRALIAPGPFSLVDTTTATSSSGSSLISGQTYFLRVTAYSAGNDLESAPSNVVVATPGPYAVFPYTVPSIFDNDTGITNQNARWDVLSESPLDGTFTYFNGGGFQYDRGSQIGTASFEYVIYNYDGLGSEASAVVTITVE